MSETENRKAVCAANCPFNRVITVHEIGYREHEYRNLHSDSFAVPWHLTEFKYIRMHHFVLHAIKEIGRFDLPVFEFKEKKSPGFFGWLGGTTVEWTTVKNVRGGWIRLDNGQTICVSETFEELKELIEGTNEEESK